MSKTSCREIDLLMIDTIAGRHWLHPEERMKGKLGGNQHQASPEASRPDMALGNGNVWPDARDRPRRRHREAVPGGELARPVAARLRSPVPIFGDDHQPIRNAKRVKAHDDDLSGAEARALAR